MNGGDICVWEDVWVLVYDDYKFFRIRLWFGDEEMVIVDYLIDDEICLWKMDIINLYFFFIKDVEIIFLIFINDRFIDDI